MKQIIHINSGSKWVEVNIPPIRTGVLCTWEGFTQFIVGFDWMNNKQMFIMCIHVIFFTVSVSYDKDPDFYAAYLARIKQP